MEKKGKKEKKKKWGGELSQADLQVRVEGVGNGSI